MSSLVFRPYGESNDPEGYWHTRDMTYNDGVRTPPESRVFKTTQAFVGEYDGRTVACFNVLDLTCTRGDRALLKCAGIAGVAVLPEYRHLGIGSKMMAWSLSNLRERGYQMASLYGFRESFYRKSGYEACGARVDITCPSHLLPRLKPELPVGKVGKDDHAKLQACHEAFARRMGGMNIREPMHWGRVLDDKKAIYTVGDPVEAYAIVDHSVNFWVPQWVNEVVWSSMRGYRSILAVLSGICINKTVLQWSEPLDTPFMAHYLDKGIEAKYAQPIMYRVLDVPGALAALKPVGAGSFDVTVTDELLPANNGPWRVEDDGTTVKVEKGTGTGLKASIQRWTQAYLGEPGFDRLDFEEQPASDLAAARKFLPSIPVYCQEGF